MRWLLLVLNKILISNEQGINFPSKDRMKYAHEQNFTFTVLEHGCFVTSIQCKIYSSSCILFLNKVFSLNIRVASYYFLRC